MPTHRFSIKLLLPLVIVGVFLPAGIAITGLDYLQRKQALIDEAKTDYAKDTALLALRLESQLRVNDIDGAIRVLSIEASRNDLNYLLIVGSNSEVLLSSRYEWVGKNIADIDAEIAPAMLPAMGARPHVAFADHNRIRTSQQINLLNSQTTPAKFRQITLIGEFSYAAEMRRFKESFYFHATVIGGLLLLLAALIFGLLRAWVGRPFDQLKAYLNNLASFRFERPQIGGSLEIHELADALAETTRRLFGSEQSLGKATAILHSLLNSIPDLIHYKDIDGRYLGANDAYVHFFGLDNDANLIGKLPTEILPEHGHRLEMEDRQVLISGQTIRSEEWFTNHDGFRHLFETVKVPLTDASGSIIGTIGISRDITERRLLEEQLAHAQKLEALGTLVAGIAHNFNNILAGILGKTYLAHSAAVSPETIQHLDDIDRLGSRAVELVRQLMSFARKDHIDSSDINLSALCKESLNTLQLGMPESIQFTSSITADEIHIIGAPSLLQQVIFNLVNNARDAVMEMDGDREIEVRLYSSEPPASLRESYQAHGWCCLSVWDNGSGIAESDREKIFEPFFTTKDPGAGTGLGLASTMGTVSRLNGTIEFDSRPETGTEFRVYLPVSPGKEIVARGIGEVVVPKASRSFTVLIVDDERDLSQTLHEVLNKLGYRTLTAKNGQEGLALFKHEGEIDLVITDLAMPVMGGEQMMKRIWEARPDLPAIFISGYAHDGHEAMPESHGKCCRYIQKPTRIPELVELIRELLGEQ